MKKFKINFQIIIIGIFLIAAITGFILFSRASGGSSKSQQTITVWGTLDRSTMITFVDQLATKTLTVQYVQKNQDTFEQELLEALAAGTGPDLFIFSQENALKYRKFVLEIPYQSYQKRTYQNTFIEEANLFLTDTGITAFPMIVDPLVMYYNRLSLASAFITEPPKYWDELVTFVPRVTSRSVTGTLLQSGIGLGTYDNVQHAKEIFSAIVLQSGNTLVGRDNDGKYQATMRLEGTGIASPGASVLRYYTSFADNAMQNYTWNASLQKSDEMFVAGDVALYIGFASELPGLRARNPNLNFDVTLLPQTRNSVVKATYGRMYGIGISRGTRNAAIAASVAASFAGKDIISALSTQMGLPPVRKDLLLLRPDDATFTSVFYNSAIISRGWLDPDPLQSTPVFKRMIDNTNAQISEPYQSINRADTDLNVLLRAYNTN